MPQEELETLARAIGLPVVGGSWPAARHKARVLQFQQILDGERPAGWDGPHSVGAPPVGATLSGCQRQTQRRCSDCACYSVQSVVMAPASRMPFTHFANQRRAPDATVRPHHISCHRAAKIRWPLLVRDAALTTLAPTP